MGRRWREDPISVRLTPATLQWLTDHTTLTGKSRKATINEALVIYQKIKESEYALERSKMACAASDPQTGTGHRKQSATSFRRSRRLSIRWFRTLSPGHPK